MTYFKTRSYLVWPLMLWSLCAPAQTANTVAVSGRDFIVAVVDAMPITNHDVTLRSLQLRDQLIQQGQAVPTNQVLSKQALEKLIVEKSLLQYAKEGGITVEDSFVDQAEQRMAAQNQLTLPELHKKINAEGTSVGQMRQNLREQLVLQRLSDRHVPERIKISDAEVDQAVQNLQNATVETNPDIELGHILIAVPEKATDSEVNALRTKAENILAQVKNGDDFARLAKEFSDSAERDKGGLMGLRPLNRYPTLFVDAIKKLRAGEVAPVIRSGAGFHILKLVTKRASNVVTVTETHPRHILIRPSGQVSQISARAQLSEFKRLIESGKADFATLAREHSQDGSASNGGDLTWVSPGMLVPEFEEVMNKLSIGQISDPLISRFGVHLIQVLERREAPITERQLRDLARNSLREKKYEDTYQLWVQEVRGRAYVEYRDPPQ